MMRQESAERLALQALTWLVGDEALLRDFMVATGVSAEDVARSAARPEFLASVLDFLLMEDRWVVAFCDEAGLAYDQPMQARAVLPGGEAMNWT